MGVWQSTPKHWPWTGKNQFLIKSNGIKYELIDGKYKQSYNIQTEYEIPVQVMILKGDIIRARQNHQTITAT